MLRLRGRMTLLLALSLALVALPTPARTQSASSQYQVFLPLVLASPPDNPFGFDVRANIDDTVMEYVRMNPTPPKWTRAGDVLWSDIEPVRGGGYQWGVLAQVEANVARIRAAGIEPVLIVQRSPAWAQRVPGRLCSPPAAQYIDDFARFMGALAARYADGPLAVHYWEIWNEPDVSPTQVTDNLGFGCWADASLPYYGGAYYGEVLKRVYPSIKAANPDATVIGGALLYFWPDDTVSQSFLRGLLATGAGQAVDALSFHAYGEWGAGDVLISKTNRIRQVLSDYGLAGKPLFATEIAATCNDDSPASCPPDFDSWKNRQANYAARIYAEAMALDLKGAFWYTLAIDNPGFRFSQLIDAGSAGLTPRPAFYAFRNSARLLNGARYIGPPIVELPADQIDKVQELVFQKPGSTLHVLWVQQTDFPEPYNLVVPPGARAACTDHLDRNPDDPDPMMRPQHYDCSDVNNDGIIPRAVNGLPQYVEIFR